MDFTKPINPGLSPSAFAGVSVADAANNLYNGSAGGAAFSLAGVTDGNGTTNIENVPPGKYKVQAWHETLGKQEKDVEVKAGQTAKVAFEMKK